VKRTRIARYLCNGVTVLVLLGMAYNTVQRELQLLQGGAPMPQYPATIYFVLPIPGTSRGVQQPGATGADFSQVYTSGKALAAGESAYLNARGRSTDVFGRPAGYPPLMNWVYVPITYFPYSEALVIHTGFWIFALVLASTMLLAKMGALRHWLPLMAAMASLYFLTPSGITHLERGQFDLVLATASVLAVFCVVAPGEHWLLAVLIGVMGALKWTAVSYLGCFAALSCLVGSWRKRFMFALIPVMMAVGTFAFWQGLHEYWPTIQKYEIYAEPGGVTFQWFLPRTVVKLIPVVLTLAVAGMIFARARSTVERRQLLLAIIAPFSLALMCVAICFGTLSYEYHTVSLLGVIPGVVVWLERAPLVSARLRIAVALGFGLFVPYAFRVYGFGDLLAPRTVTQLYACMAFYAFVLCGVIIARASPALAGPESHLPVQRTRQVIA
jgi:hypothetical protein